MLAAGGAIANDDFDRTRDYTCVDASDIEVTELDSGWAVKFLGDAQVPTLNLHFNLPGVATEVVRALDFVAKENARQTIALPLGFDEISVSYGDQSSLIDLRPFQLTGNEDHHDFPIQHTENDLSSLFSGIPVLENCLLYTSPSPRDS